MKFEQLILLIIIILALVYDKTLHPTIETANMGVINQLQTSSTDPLTMPYGYSPWLRPVMQRGINFYYPQWSR